MFNLELPCKVGDTAYWVTAWDEYAFQKDHNETILKIIINENEVIFVTKSKNLKLSELNKYWFISKYKWLKAGAVMRKARVEAEKAIVGLKD